MGWRTKCAALVLLALGLTLATAASGKMNTGYLLPGHEFKVAPSGRGDIARFCALTFDDGPDANNTPQVLQILKDKGVHATFFVVGRNVRGFPDQVRRIAGEGHEVANHSWSHADFTKLSAKQQRSELDKCSAELAKLGITPRWFRPPYGAFNKSTTRQAKDAGLIPLLWSVDPRDWAEPGASTIVSRVLKQTTNGGVILLHSTHAQTVEALPSLIDKLRDKGYSFVTLSEWQALVTGQQLPVPVNPGLPEHLQDHSPDPGQPGDSLPGIGEDNAAGEPVPLIRVEPFRLKPLKSEGWAEDGRTDDSRLSADGAAGAEHNTSGDAASGPYEISEDPADAPREPSEWQFAAPPTLLELLDAAPSAAASAVDGAGGADLLGRANAARLRQWTRRVLGLRKSGQPAGSGTLDLPALDPLRIHSNFRSAEELENWLR